MTLLCKELDEEHTSHPLVKHYRESRKDECEHLPGTNKTAVLYTMR